MNFLGDNYIYREVKYDDNGVMKTKIVDIRDSIEVFVGYCLKIKKINERQAVKVLGLEKIEGRISAINFLENNILKIK